MSETFVPGLAGVPAAKSSIGFINGLEGILRYRGIRIEELAEHGTFEEIVHLLVFGRAPTAAELRELDAELCELRAVPSGIIDILSAMPQEGHPMVALQTAIAALGAFYPAMDVSQWEGNRKAALRLIAAMPTLTAAFDRLRKGEAVVAPDPALGHAANFLYMLRGAPASEQVSRLLDVCLILHAEHGFNASTFTGRVVGATLANPYSVIAAAIGSLSGPLHGGATERVLRMLAGIDSVDGVEAFLDQMIETRQKIMGLGHRVYRVKDPRATVLERMAGELFAHEGSTPMHNIAVRVEQVAAQRLGAKGIYPNVDFYSGLVYEKLGIETDLFTPIFAIARVAGWVAHWLEQLEDNRIYRPTQIYVGPGDVKYVPIEERG